MFFNTTIKIIKLSFSLIVSLKDWFNFEFQTKTNVNAHVIPTKLVTN